MQEIYPDNYWKDKYESKTPFRRYWHGVKFARRNKMLIKWHVNLIRLWLLTR